MTSRFEIRLALRYLWAARKKAHTAFLSLISAAGVTVGVAVLLFALALLSGLQGQIKNRLIVSGPQLVVEPRSSTSIAESEQIVDALSRFPGTKTIEPQVGGIAWAANKDGDKGRPVRVRSFLPFRRPRIEESFGRIWKSDLPSAHPELLVTRSFAAELGLFLGDDVIIVAPRMQLTPFGPVPVTRKMTITQLVASAGDEHAPDAFIAYDQMSSLFGTNGEPTSIEVRTSAEQAEQMKEQLQPKFAQSNLRSWKDLNRPLFLALRLEKIVMFATISLIVLVAALNLVSSLSMLIVEKRPQVGILRTLGATEKSILGVFLAVGLLIGLSGTIAGNIIGLGLAWSANHWGLIRLPAEMYYLNHIPFEIDLTDVLVVNVISVVMSVLATYYPARLASRLDPIVAIRDE